LPTTLDKPPAYQSARKTGSTPLWTTVQRRHGRPERRVILEADDLGLTYSFSEGIRRAHLQGCLASTCLRANGYAYDHAVHRVLADCPRLGVGVHLCLNEGECVAEAGRVPHLLDSGQRFRHGYLWLIRVARSPVGRLHIERELRAQIEKTLDNGVHIDHLNSHQHVHMIPPIFGITCRLAAEYGISGIRLAREPAYLAPGLAKRLTPLANANYIKHVLLNRFAQVDAPVARESGLATTGCFVGVNYSGRMDLGTVAAGLEAADGGSVEVLLHPTLGPDPRDVAYPAAYLRDYVAAPQRAVELATLTSAALPDLLRRHNWTITGFADLATRRRRGPWPETAPQVPERIRRLCNGTVVTGPPWVSDAHADARAFTQLVAARLVPGQRVLDLGTGTGICAICVAKLGYQVVASDVSAAAVRCADDNAARNGVSFELCRSDLLESVDGRFDLIAFNLPYNFAPDTWAANLAKNLLRRITWVRRHSGRSMPAAIRKFHQRLLRRLIDQAPEHLERSGEVLLHVFKSEVGPLTDVLPAEADVEILRHADLTANGTVGLSIRLERR
jgi:predicted glycoside hydrolase/deacetylase ChbG (UPF0249 family)